MELALDPQSLDQLTDWMDLRPVFEGSGIHSLSNSADEKFLGSFAAIASAIISFYRITNLPVYIRIAEALEELDAPQLAVPLCALAAKVKEVSDMLLSHVSDITDEELISASHLVKGHRTVEVPGLEHRTPLAPEPVRPLNQEEWLTTSLRHASTNVPFSSSVGTSYKPIARSHPWTRSRAPY